MTIAYTRIARVTKPHGTSGFFSIEPFAVDSLSVLHEGDSVCIVPPLNELSRWLPVEKISGVGSENVRVKLAGVDTRGEAEKLSSRFFLVEKTPEVAKHLLPCADAALSGGALENVNGPAGVDASSFAFTYANPALLDFHVFDEELGELGLISDISNNGAHALWEIALVADPQKTFLFPAVDAYVQEIDSDKKKAKIQLPAGLLDEETVAILKTTANAQRKTAANEQVKTSANAQTAEPNKTETPTPASTKTNEGVRS